MKIKTPLLTLLAILSVSVAQAQYFMNAKKVCSFFKDCQSGLDAQRLTEITSNPAPDCGIKSVEYLGDEVKFRWPPIKGEYVVRVLGNRVAEREVRVKDLAEKLKTMEDSTLIAGAIAQFNSDAVKAQYAKFNDKTTFQAWGLDQAQSDYQRFSRGFENGSRAREAIKGEEEKIRQREEAAAQASQKAKTGLAGAEQSYERAQKFNFGPEKKDEGPEAVGGENRGQRPAMKLINAQPKKLSPHSKNEIPAGKPAAAEEEKPMSTAQKIAIGGAAALAVGALAAASPIAAGALGLVALGAAAPKKASAQESDSTVEDLTKGFSKEYNDAKKKAKTGGVVAKVGMATAGLGVAAWAVPALGVAAFSGPLLIAGGIMAVGGGVYWLGNNVKAMSIPK